jgi:EKC/KEOPS complex subunit CGI121/TPRKB
MMTDIARVKKIYKLNNLGGANGRGKEGTVDERDRTGQGIKEVEMLVLGSMALRGATN